MRLSIVEHLDLQTPLVTHHQRDCLARGPRLHLLDPVGAADCVEVQEQDRCLVVKDLNDLRFRPLPMR